MNLIALAVPFFLLAIIIELLVDRARGSGYFRANDAINSLSVGILNSTSGYFTKFIQFLAWGFALQNFVMACRYCLHRPVFAVARCAAMKFDAVVKTICYRY